MSTDKQPQNPSQDRQPPAGKGGRMSTLPDRPPDYYLPPTADGEVPVWRIREGTVPREVLARVARGLLAWGREREARDAAEAEISRLTPTNGRAGAGLTAKA